VSELPLGDIQGIILRGYRFSYARHLVLHSNGSPAGAREFVRALLPEVTTAEEWHQKPASALNVGITYQGLLAVGLDTDELNVPLSFQLGPTDPTIAQRVSDIGASAPQQWLGNLGNPTTAHFVLTLFAESAGLLAELAGRWMNAIPTLGLSIPFFIDAEALPGQKVHFGYRDGIAQPNVEGVTRKNRRPDMQPQAPPGEFLLGHPNQMGGTYTIAPTELSLNSSFGAFRILQQDVAGFESFLQAAAAQTGSDVEFIAAKVCGRWRNGNPLVLAPTSQLPLLPDRELNDFSYGSATGLPDALGLSCPVGSHIRRANPRDENVGGLDGLDGHRHRIVRRAMPYGPKYDGAHPDEAARGLVGYFINADFLNQFEFIMNSWINTDTFVHSVPLPGGNPALDIAGQEPILGCAATGNQFLLTQPPLPEQQQVHNVAIDVPTRFVTTRGGIYCYLPSLSALRFLSKLRDVSPR
jgi:deferrochelatase/peroxidase EfeB